MCVMHDIPRLAVPRIKTFICVKKIILTSKNARKVVDLVVFFIFAYSVVIEFLKKPIKLHNLSLIGFEECLLESIRYV